MNESLHLPIFSAEFGVGTRRLNSDCAYDFYSVEIPQKSGKLYYLSPFTSNKMNFKENIKMKSRTKKNNKKVKVSKMQQDKKEQNETECRYYFHGASDERIVLNVTKVRFHKASPFYSRFLCSFLFLIHLLTDH